MKIKAIFGLGNPSKEYEKTFHNAGEMFVDYLAQELKSAEKRKFKKFEYKVAETGNGELYLFGPMSFMNESGPYIAAAMKHMNLAPKEILVAHDDSDIPLGKFKISPASRSAGHRGAQSLIDTLGTKNFARLRIGIRSKPGKALDFVLKKIPHKDLDMLEDVFEGAAKRLISEYL